MKGPHTPPTPPMRVSRGGGKREIFFFRDKIAAQKGGETMNARRQKFCVEFLRTGSAAEAARIAGYSPRSARSQGQRLLTCADIKRFIAHELNRAKSKGLADADEVLMYLSQVMRGELKDQFGLDCSIADRTNAAKLLLKRLDVADGRQGTLERLDHLLFEFRLAVCGLDSDDEDEDDMPTD